MPDEDDSDELSARRKKRASEESSKTPWTPRQKASPGRVPPSGPPRVTAVGYSGDWDNRYKPGDNVICRIVAPEVGGYAVTVAKDNLPGFLPSDEKYQVGEQVLAQFVCVSGRRVLLQPKLSSSGLNPWKREGGGQQLMGAQEISANPAPPGQLDFRFRRATDLILPSIAGEMPSKVKAGDVDVRWIISDLEAGKRTGCVKSFSEEKKSRAAMLLYRGRAVGCVYGSETMIEPQPTEPSLHMMFADMLLNDTEILIYDLPEEVVLAFSALFLGYPVERKDTLDARSYTDYIVDWLHGKQLTACLAFSFPSRLRTSLSFIHQGNFVGSFYVEEQKFSSDPAFVYELISEDPATKTEASILPPEMTLSSVRYGFKLTMGGFES